MRGGALGRLYYWERELQHLVHMNLRILGMLVALNILAAGMVFGVPGLAIAGPPDAPAGDNPVHAPPVNAPPADAPPVNAPPVDAPPVNAPPVDAPPTNMPPTDAPPDHAAVNR